MKKLIVRRSSRIFLVTFLLLVTLKILKDLDIDVPLAGILYWGILLFGFTFGAIAAEKEKN